MEAQPFTILGTYHLLTLMFIVVLAIFFPLLLKEKSIDLREHMGFVFAPVTSNSAGIDASTIWNLGLVMDWENEICIGKKCVFWTGQVLGSKS